MPFLIFKSANIDFPEDDFDLVALDSDLLSR